MILFRLLKQQEDGSFKVVGYEMATVSGVREIDWYSCRKVDGLYHKSYIPHSRKDLYTGIEVDGVKLFERDVVETNHGTHLIKYWSDRDYPAFDLMPLIDIESNGIQTCICAADESIKIIGIEGVNNGKTCSK
jgi:hypothetical protein